MTDFVVITGSGLVTPLGSSVDETWNALIERQFIRTHATAKLGPSRESLRLTHIAHHAATEAIVAARWTQADLSDDRTALIVGTSRGPVEQWTTAPPTQKTSTSDKDTAGRLHFGLSTLADELAERFRFGHGPRLTTSAACASSLHALIRAVMLVRTGQVDRALVVAAESSLQPLFLGSFQRLGVFPPAGVGCKPFDTNRAGFLMSECAAAVCVERISTTTSHAQVAVDRFGLGGDATHLTAGDPAARTLRRLLTQCAAGKSFDLIHAHGTGTPTNDATELTAIEDSIDRRIRPTVYSHKGAIGHSLGAAGLAAVVLNMRAHEQGVVPPNVQTTDPVATRLQLSNTVVRRPIRSSLITAAGFGGATAVLTLSTL